MAAVKKPAPTVADIAATAIRIQEKLEQADELLTQAGKDAAELGEVVEGALSQLERFHLAVREEALWLENYIGPEHGDSEFEISEAVKSIREFLDLLEYATRKDG